MHLGAATNIHMRNPCYLSLNSAKNHLKNHNTCRDMDVVMDGLKVKINIERVGY